MITHHASIEGLREPTVQMTRIPIALATMLAPSCSHASDLMDAYKYARSNDPTISRFDSLRWATRENVNLARAPLLPRISVNLGLNEKKSNDAAASVNPGHTRERTEAIAIDQRVLDISKQARLSAAKSSSQAQDATYEAALQRLATRVAVAYFAILTNEDALAVAKANERSLGRLQEEAGVRLDVGVATITDVQDARARHDTSVAAVATAEQALADSSEALSQITGRPVDQLKKLREKLPMNAPPTDYLEALVARAIMSSPSVLAARHNVESAQHGIAAAHAGTLPTLDANVTYRRTAAWTQTSAANIGTPGRRCRSGLTISLTLKIPIFSASTQRSNVRRAIYQREAAQDSLESTRRQVVRDMLKHHRSVVAGVSKVRATKAAVESFESALEGTQVGFRVGSRTIVDVLIAQHSLTRSLMSHSLARHQFIIDKLLLKEAAGSVDTKDLEEINRLLR